MNNYPILSLDECIDRLISVKNPLILIHVRPDGDTVGSARGLIEVYRALGIEAKYAGTDAVGERLGFLLEGAAMAKPCEYSSFTPISIDVPSPMQLGKIMEALPEIYMMIDHHEVATPFAPIYTIKGMSSAGEVLYGIVKRMCERGILTLSEAIAYPIFAAIASDSGSFAYSCTSSATHLAAADLIDTGIDHADIIRRLFASKSPSQIRAEGMTAERIKTAADGKIAYAYISKADRASAGLEFSDFETAIDIVRAARGNEISFVIKETDSGEYKGSIRSVGADVTRVAVLYSGGGHIRAAGCTIEAESSEAAAQMLLNSIMEMYY